ncbi:MAG: HD-GYP domain-containing protein [Bacteriovoracia bacterium]
MLRSKNIQDYFSVPFAGLTPDTVITFDLHLYFQMNQHIVLWKPEGDYLTAPFFTRYTEKGLQQCWIHNSQRGAYELYLQGPPKIPDVPAAGIVIAQVLASPHLTEPQKQAVVAEVAVDVIQNAMEAKTLDEQKTEDKKVNDTVREVLAQVQNPAQELMDELWKMADYDPQMEHSVNVANYTALFAMAFGKIDLAMLSDLALAGLLHDVGVSQVAVELAAMPVKNHDATTQAEYAKHVAGSSELVRQFSPDVTERVHKVLAQHHEKFNGTGYPNQLKGFDFDDLAQLVAMADLIDTLTSGQWDGEKRTLREAFTFMNAKETSKNFPEYFNPEIFTLVMGWIRGSDSDDSVAKARDIVEQQVKSLVGSDLRGA